MSQIPLDQELRIAALQCATVHPGKDVIETAERFYAYLTGAAPVSTSPLADALRTAADAVERALDRAVE